MNQYEFEQKIVRQYGSKRLPLRGIFELTGRCNLNCKMCYVHTKSNAEFLSSERNGDWWISQIDAACKKGMLFATLTGGECMIHPDFKRIYSHLRQQGVYTRINTNGLLLTEQNLAFLKKSPPFEIQITLYGASDDSYEKVTGFRVFGVVESAIERVREVGLNMRVAITPNSYAPGETEKILEYLIERDIPYSINQSMFTAYDDNAEQSASSDVVSTEEQIRYLRKSLNIETAETLNVELPPIGGNTTEAVCGIRCSAGRNTFVLTNDGYMQPCIALHHLRTPAFTSDDFNQAWDATIGAADNYFMPIECEGCAYKQACISCPVARSGKIGNGHCDPDVCKTTRSLVAAGVRTLTPSK